MITKEDWISSSKEARKLLINQWLAELVAIEKGIHENSKHKSGKLRKIKRELQQNLYNALDWEREAEENKL